MAILRGLQKDGGRPRKELAKETGFSEAVLSKRIASAEAVGLIKETVTILDRVKLGFLMLAFFTVECKDSKAAQRVAELLVKDANVQEVHMLDGTNPLFVKIVARTPEQLSQWQDKVASYGDVVSARGRIVMRTMRESLALPI